MKSLNKFTTGLAGLLLMLTSLSCSKSLKETFLTQSNFSNTSQIQVYIPMVNATRNYIYIDGNPITGSTMSTASIFPSSGYAASITGGLRNFLVRDTSSLITATQVPLSFAENMQAGKNYTIFIYDTISAPKQKTVQTDIVIPSDTTARLRLANFVYNPTGIPAVDVYSFIKGANIFTNLQVTDVTGFIPYASGANVPGATTTDTLYFRETGTLNQITKQAITLTLKRNYTVVLRGSYRSPTKLVSVITNY